MVKVKVKIVNIVCSTSLEHDIHLIKLAETLPNTEYNPEQFPGLVMRIREPKTSALIFSSGKVTCQNGFTRRNYFYNLIFAPKICDIKLNHDCRYFLAGF